MSIDTPTGMSPPDTIFQPVHHPGQQTPAQAQNPLDTDLYPPDHTYDPIGYAEWKQEQAEPGKPATRSSTKR